MKLADIWDAVPETAPNAQRTVADLKDGIYTVEVTAFRFFRSDAGPYYHCWEMVVRDGLRKGAYTEKFSNCGEISMEILKKDVRRVAGRWVPLAEIYDEDNDRLGPAVGELVGAVLEVQKKDDPKGRINQKTGKPYFNINFLKLVSPAGGVVAADNGGPPEQPADDFMEDPEGDTDEEEEEAEPLDDDDIPF